MSRLGLFEGYGVEIEYMIVDAGTLDVRPVCDRLMEAVAGAPAAEIERDGIAWSNELVLHVLELKTNGPAPGLEGLGRLFHEEVLVAEGVLAEIDEEGRVGERRATPDGGRSAGGAQSAEGAGPITGCTLLPGGVHPWMDPGSETRLWPHEYNEVYRSYDRIFGCRGHGWSNLQSTHLNLPFDGDDELARLHSAIRAVLPLIPALAASSPFLDGEVAPHLDARLDAYRGNSGRIPEMAGLVVPEPVGSEAEYRERILEPLYRALEPHDPAGVLRHEWANSRGCIARFDRGAVEVRVIDAQECVSADLAVIAMVTAVVRALAEERWAPIDVLDRVPTAGLADLLGSTIRDGGDAVVGPGSIGPAMDRDATRAYLGAFGWGRSEATALDLWRSLADRLAPDSVPGEYGPALETIATDGPLASRMVRAHRDGGRSILEVAGDLVSCLREDRLFRVG